MIFDCPKYDRVRLQFPSLFSWNLGLFLSQDPTAHGSQCLVAARCKTRLD